ncbi:hypothetical protein [Gibbsiella quercinecans]|nr:hypothetical protein [Gibbsiella quercinecans]
MALRFSCWPGGVSGAVNRVLIPAARRIFLCLIDAGSRRKRLPSQG